MDQSSDKKNLSVKNQVVELRCSEVRWFYKKQKDEKWTKLCGRDSLLIEVQYRFSRGVNLDAEATDEVRVLAARQITILADLYKVDIESLEATTIYWDDDPLELCRGRWFDLSLLQPIDDELAELVENEHLNVFRGHNIPATPVYSDREGGKKPWTTSLRRAFPVRAVLSDGPKPVGHLILVIPGIGQKMYRRAIIDNTSCMREHVDETFESHFRLAENRPMLLPIEWRSELLLDGDTVEVATLPYVSGLRATLNTTALDILYYSSATYRTEILAGLARVLQRTYKLFMDYHPDYQGKVSLFAHSLGSVIAYDILAQFTPLSIYESFVDARITELLKSESAEISDEQRRQLTEISQARNQVHNMESAVDLTSVYRSAAPQLPFNCDTLFCAGSPLAVFLALRGDGVKVDNLVPKNCANLVNLFHPADPVAYRLEPLLVREYWYVRPLRVHWAACAASGGDYDQMKPELHNNRRKKAARDKTGRILVCSSTVAQQLDKLKCDKVQGGSGESLHNAKADSDGSEKAPSDIPVQQPISVHIPDSAHLPALGGNGKQVGLVSSPDLSDDESSVPGKTENSKDNRWFGRWRSGTTDNKEKDKDKENDEKRKSKAEPNVEETAIPKDGQQFLNELPPEKRLSPRIDFMLRTSATEVSYLSILSSHFTYWESADVATFLMQQLYPGLMEKKK